MNLSEHKKQLRRELILRRRQMSAEAKAQSDAIIFQRLLPYLRQAGSVFTYVSTEIEVGTHELMSWCFRHNIPVAVPVSGDSELTFYQVSSFEELAEGRFHILEPTERTVPLLPDENSLCIVPALLCDRTGLRLGYGRGYYDRYLAAFPGKSVVICYSGFVGDVPAEPHDRRADLVITD